MGRKSRRRAIQKKKQSARERKAENRAASQRAERARSERLQAQSGRSKSVSDSSSDDGSGSGSSRRAPTPPVETSQSLSKTAPREAFSKAYKGRGKLLEVRDLKTEFHTEAGVATAVNGVSFNVYEGEVLGIVGESGSGKSVTSLSIMRLIPDPPGKISEGEIVFKGQDLLELSWPEVRKVRGREIAMIFQEPMTSLNPVYTVGFQIMEVLEHHEGLSKKEAFDRAVKLLEEVGIPDPAKRMHDYPHQFSGGMRQRAMIAIALACNPSLLIADEPTTALDVTIQAQILELMMRVKDHREEAAVILITHDLAVVAETCERVIVMYGGMVQEVAPVSDLFKNPKHPYTKGLLASLPRPDLEQDKLSTIPGMVPNIHNFPAGCRFATRCDVVEDRCWDNLPELMTIGDGRLARCHLLENERVEGAMAV